MKINNNKIKSLFLLSLVGSGLGKNDSQNKVFLQFNGINLSAMLSQALINNKIGAMSDDNNDNNIKDFRDLVQAVGEKFAEGYGTWLVDCSINGWLNWQPSPTIAVVNFKEGDVYGYRIVEDPWLSTADVNSGTIVNDSNEAINHTYTYALQILDRTQTTTTNGYKHGINAEGTLSFPIPNIPGVSGSITVGGDWSWDTSTSELKRKDVTRTSTIIQQFRVEAHSSKNFNLTVRQVNYKLEMRKEVDISGFAGWWFHDKVDLNNENDWHWEWFPTPRTVIEKMFGYISSIPTEVTEGYWQGDGDVAKFEARAVIDGTFGIDYTLVVSDSNSNANEEIRGDFREFEANIEVPSKH